MRLKNSTRILIQPQFNPDTDPNADPDTNIKADTEPNPEAQP